MNEWGCRPTIKLVKLAKLVRLAKPVKLVKLFSLQGEFFEEDQFGRKGFFFGDSVSKPKPKPKHDWLHQIILYLNQF